MRCLRLELLTCLVKIDLLLSKSQRLSLAERHRLHAECGGIEGYGCVDVGYGEYEVIEMVDRKFHLDRMHSKKENQTGYCANLSRRPSVSRRNLMERL